MEALTEQAIASWREVKGGPISICVPVGDHSRVGEARRAAEALALECGLDSEERGVLSLVVTEAATNLAQHAQNGSVFVRDLRSAGRLGVEVLTVDAGPGMQNVVLHEEDGFSTKGTAGQGLGAMRRLAHEFDVYSQYGVGTVVVARVFAAADRARSDSLLVHDGVVCTALEGEAVCGDGWRIQQKDDRTMAFVVDGLGHGAYAAEAADAACAIFSQAAHLPPLEVLGAVHAGLRSTRGAAVMVVEIVADSGGALVKAAGAGNIFAAVVGVTGTRALPSTNGTAGLQLRSPREFRAAWSRRQRMIICTDGITTRWKLDAYPGVFERDPAIAAALIRRDHSRGRDDATVMSLSLAPR